MVEYLNYTQLLHNHLFEDYIRELPPIYSRSRYSEYIKLSSIVVTLYYARLLSLNEPEQIATMIVEFDLFWQDARLAWNPSEFADIAGIVVNRKKLWVPDIVAYDSQYFTDPRDDESKNIYITSEGRCSYFVTSVVSFFCRLDIQRFPFDKQQCVLNMLSNTFQPSEVSIQGILYHSYDFGSTSNGVWDCENVTVAHDDILNEDQDWSYEVASFTFVLQRSAYYYSFLIIIPSFIMTFLCVVGLFWTSFDYERCLEKLNLGFAAILAEAMVLQITDSSIPRTTQMPILSTFILCNLLLVSFATLVVLIMSKLSTYSWYGCFEKRYRSTIPRLFSPRLVCLFFFTTLSIVNVVFLYAKVW